MPKCRKITSTPALPPSNLQIFEHFCQKASKTVVSVKLSLFESTWELYESDLRRLYDRELSDQEINSERNTYLRTQFVRKNITFFTTLSQHCQALFREITESDRQKILGETANLELWDPDGRTAGRVEFKPPKLFPSNCETLDECLEALAIPASFGARLLWQLAARTAPEAFGYSLNSLNLLFLEPFWTVISSIGTVSVFPLESLDIAYECTFDDRSLQLILHAARNVSNITPTASTAGQSKNKIQRHIGMKDDGTFQWDGEFVKFRGKQRELFKLVFEQYLEGKPLPVSSAGKLLPKRDVQSRGTLSSMAYHIRQKLKKVPLYFTYSNPDNWFTIEYTGKSPNPLF